MAYFKLQVKKVLKNNLTWISLTIALLAVGLLLAYNAAAPDQLSVHTQVTQDLRQNEKEQARVKANLAQHPGSKSDKEQLTIISKQINSDKAILIALNQQNWSIAYRLMINQNNHRLKQVKSDNSELKEHLKQNNLHLGVLLQANVPEENELHPKRGFLFIFKLLEGLLPILATVMLCFILSNLFTAKYVDRLNRATLLPNDETTTIDLMTGLLVTFVLILIVSSVAFGISGLLFGSGSLSYPVQAFALPKEAPQYLPLAAWLVPTIGLMVLAFIFMVVLIQFIAQVSCNQLSCLFISLVLLLGGAVLPLLMQSVEKQAQFSFVRYLPTTYILAFQVVTGRFGLALRDLHLNFASGCQVLVIAIVALAILNLLWPKIAQQVGQYFSK
ncbi:hypothetical protein [Lactobacillus sp.]|uniref:hypothetical protein n=1 Tax=Lactobacillus sp. TaxID=1591 RepID=UPI0025DED4E8|nr:hypothetical protein [Lactobacillus sp.]MCO6532080.1 hypothetical protein [Lactobacillus sp.]